MRRTARRVISWLLALILLSTAGLSQVMGPPRAARSVATVPVSADERAFPAAPLELVLREDVREACSRFPLPPAPWVLERRIEEDDVQAFEGLVQCAERGPLAGQTLVLFGPAPVAQSARALLQRAGLAAERLVIADVPLDPLASPDVAPRVVLAPAEPR